MEKLDLPPAADTNQWTENQTGQGLKYYYNAELNKSQWAKPDALKTEEWELNNKTDWESYRIWSGREYFYNRKTKVSCWAVPPEIAKLRGIDPEPEYEELSKSMPMTFGEQRTAFREVLERVGVTHDMTFEQALALANKKDPEGYNILSNLADKRQVYCEHIAELQKRSVLEAQIAKRDAADAFRQEIKKLEWIKAGTAFEVVFENLKGDNAWTNGPAALTKTEQQIIFTKIATDRMEEISGEDRPIIRRRTLDSLKKVYSEHPALDYKVRYERLPKLMEEMDDEENKDIWRKATELDRVGAWNEFVLEMEDTQEQKSDAASTREARLARDAFRKLLQSRLDSNKLKKTWETEEKQIKSTEEYKNLAKIVHGSTPQDLFNMIRGIKPPLPVAETLNLGGDVDMAEQPQKKARSGQRRESDGIEILGVERHPSINLDG